MSLPPEVGEFRGKSGGYNSSQFAALADNIRAAFAAPHAAADDRPLDLLFCENHHYCASLAFRPLRRA